MPFKLIKQTKCVICVAVVGVKICTKQGRFHEVSQGSSNKETYLRYLSGFGERRKYGRMVSTIIKFKIVRMDKS